MFKLELLPRTELDCYYNDIGRIYKTPEGDFPSVTTVLGNYYNKTALNEWKKRIGEEEAERQSKIAADNGTELHGVMEKYLINADYNSAHSIAKMRFASVKRKLDQNVNKVYGIEFPLYSSRLKTAGKTDSIVNWNGDNTILDLKTTKKYKKEEYIENYFVQATTYGIMLNEAYNMGIKKIIIMFSTNEFDCYYFEKPIKDYIDLTNRIFTQR